MDTIWMAAAAVTGSRHLRASRNGQDAVATFRGGVRADGGAARGAEIAVVVVADGCGSATSSEVGAGLGARLFARALGALLATEPPMDRGAWLATFARARAGVAAMLRSISLDELGDCCMFTLVAAAVTPGGAAVWALGDGAYSFGDRTRVIGPFADNQPPYLAYDVLGDPREAHFELAPAGCDTVIVATDGACDLDGGIEPFATERNLTHPDALRRQLALLARGDERIDWERRRVVRVPAALQDDCAIGIVRVWRRS